MVPVSHVEGFTEGGSWLAINLSEDLLSASGVGARSGDFLYGRLGKLVLDPEK